MADKGDGASSPSYPLSRTVLNDITNENLSSRRPPSFLTPRSRPLVRRPSATSSSNLRQASLTELLGAGAAPRSPVFAGTPSGQKRAFEGGSSAQPATSGASSPVSSQSSLVCHGRSRVNSRDSDAGWSKEVSDGEVRSKRFRLDIVVGLDADRVEGREDIEDGPGQEHDEEVAMESIPRPRKIKDRAFLPSRTMDVSHAVLTRLAMREALKPSHFDLRPYLRGIVSNNTLDVYRLPSQFEHRDWSPPFSCAFSSGSRWQGKQWLAVGDEDGMITLLDADHDAEWDREHDRIAFSAHDNAIFDLNWSPDDHYIATASGDQSARIFDVTRGVCVGNLAGHHQSLKTVAWDPHSLGQNILSTASRDGSIRIWDRRVQGPVSGYHKAVMKIGNAHAEVVGRRGSSHSAPRSVTAALYLKHRPNVLASAGAGDGVVRLWDLRKFKSNRVYPHAAEMSQDKTTAPLSIRESESVFRPHGISSLSMSPDGEWLYGLSLDGNIYTYSTLAISSPIEFTTYRHPSLRCSTFYVRTKPSADGRYLASGSSNGRTFVWDTKGKGDDPVVLKGHADEVGCVDWSRDTLATCSDDFTLRYWKINHEVARRNMERDWSWKWSGCLGDS